MSTLDTFLDPASHGFVRASVCLPRVRVADVPFNVAETLALARQAHDRQSTLALFPELGLTAYTNDDLFHQKALLDAARDGLLEIRAESEQLDPVLIVGLPWLEENKVFNCAAVLHRGRVLGLVTKSFLPNYREYYEKRYFVDDGYRTTDLVDVAGQSVPFGADLVFQGTSSDHDTQVRFAVEICEDVWAPIPPSTYAALAGATLLCNLSSSNITIGKADYRRLLCQSQSAKCIAAYLYSASGYGESTTDLAWDGHGLIVENGELLAESERFSTNPQLLVRDLDLDRLTGERLRLSSFDDSVQRERDAVNRLRIVPLTLTRSTGSTELERPVSRFPFVPQSASALDERCQEAYNIQVQGLAKRLDASGVAKAVIGVSGGLDSTQALIVAVRAMELLGRSPTDVLAYTMPGFATSSRTLVNAHELMESLGVTATEIDIRPSCEQMLRDLGHPFSAGEPVYDVTFENVQAGERTSHLFRLANHHGGLVVGTGDLSEIALGWSTYGVGDQMSHYNVNASVPKTLIRHLIRWVARKEHFGPRASAVLESILTTEISPELVPSGDDTSTEPGQQPAQLSEEVIGPFELQDFSLYYLSRFGYAPSKVAYLAYCAWNDAEQGVWPPGGDADRRQYTLEEIKKWLEVFIRRFFAFSQFKRSAQPNGPKVGSGGSLSPRGDWRAPSDASARVWLDELRRNVP